MKRTFEEETALIKELQATCPKLDESVGFYHPNNTEWHVHHTKLRDAYWRRRMLSAKPGEVAPG